MYTCMYMGMPGMRYMTNWSDRGQRGGRGGGGWCVHLPVPGSAEPSSTAMMPAAASVAASNWRVGGGFVGRGVGMGWGQSISHGGGECLLCVAGGGHATHTPSHTRRGPLRLAHKHSIATHVQGHAEEPDLRVVVRQLLGAQHRPVAAA